MIGVHVLDVPGTDDANAGREVEGMMPDANVPCRCRQGTAAVGTKDGILGKQRLEERPRHASCRPLQE